MKTLTRRWAGMLLAGSLLFPVLPAPAAYAATLNVSSYGANGTDTVDDLAAFNAAIAAAAAGDTVYVPSGTYYVTGAIAMKSGVKLQGQSRDTSIVKFSGTADSAMINVTNATNVEITQLTIDGNNSAYVTRGIVGDPNGSGAKVHHNRIVDLAKTTGFGPFGILFSGSDNVEITDNVFLNIGTGSEWGGAVRVGWGSDNPIIARNTIANTGRGGIFLNNELTGAVIRDNTISGSGLFKQGLSIELHTGVNQSIIEDNVVDHWISIVISDFNAVRRNIVRATDGTYKSYGLEISSGNSIVTDNWVDGGQHLGISSSPARDYTYYGYNRIEDMIQWGMQFQGNNTTDGNEHQYFYKNQFLNTDKDNPLAVYGSYAGYGVRLHGYTTNVTFDSNEISGNERYGINITTTGPGVDKISFVGNTITNNGMDVIDQYPQAAADLEWSGNIVSGNNPNTQPTSRGFANLKPVANFTAPTTLLLGQSATFSNTSTDADGTLAHYLWDFGEGLPSTATSPTYVYQKPGTYRVTLMATDDGGRSAIKEHAIVVSQGPPDTQAPTAPTNLTSPSKTHESVNLSWTGSTDNLAVYRYEIYRDGTLIGWTDASTTTFQANGLQPETAYAFTIRAQDAAGNLSTQSAALNVTTNDPPGGGTGSIQREIWTGISGSLIGSIPLTTAPNATDWLTSLEGPTNYADAFGARIRGYITPDVTGSYTFRIAGDDKAELYLSTDANPANKSLIASTTDWTNYREWTRFPAQTSSAITLVGGQSYYVEVLHKEGHSGDHVSVGWTGPGIPVTTVIGGGYLSPYSSGGPSDTQAPSAPTGLASTGVTSATAGLSWTASTDNVGVTGYDVYRGSTLAGTVAGSATTFQDSGLSASTAYSYTVRAKDAAGNVSAASGALSVTTSAAGGTGSIVREYWTGVGGETIANIPVGTTPTGSDTLTSLEGPTNWADSYATRIRGYITPTASGTYTFYLASDNAGELWLSTGDNPANKTKIAYVSGWTNYRQWNASTTQQSAAIALTAGQRYYVEVLHKEKNGGDHLSVGWTGPGISAVTVVDGSFLSPYAGGGSSDTQAPTAPTGLASSGVTSTTVGLSWAASTDNVGVTGYDVYRGTTLAGTVAGSATTFQDTGLAPSTAYSYTVRAKDAAGNVSTASSALSVTTSASSGGGGGTGSIVREYWTGVGGDSIANIPVGTTPTGTQTLTSLEGPSNWGNGYADRIRGYITPTVNGAYTFYLASDNAGELWLSTDVNPANKTRIAYVNTYTGYRQWTVSSAQQSAAINLVAGQSYYVEVLHKEDASADHLSVGWTGPGISTITVVAGSYLSPY
ncbi:PA14 domain-containing protein [Cohnella sp. GCM10027633]|uniref:PA14 domain-containing protein n=1 Tax=unclassified Cohnella TaxID=2636738 RepID=UPI00362B0BF8